MSSANGISTKGHAGRVDMLGRLEEARQAASNTRQRERQAAVTFRGIAVVEGVVILMLGWLFVWVITSGVRDHVVVVKVDSLGNEVILDPAPKEPLKPEENVIHALLRQWVENVRWVSNDKRLFTLMWDKVESFSTQATLRQLQDFRAAQEARQQGGRRVQVTVTQVLKVPRTHGYTVTWREEAVDLQGMLIRDESCLCSATLDVADFQGPAARQEMDLRRRKKDFRNLFGVFVDGVQWRAEPLPPERKSS
jgi:type IV secretory pathway TrbF-like protein